MPLPLREVLRRSMLRTMLPAVATVAVPVALFQIWYLVWGRDSISDGTQVVITALASILLALWAFGITYWWIGRQAKELSRPLADLAAQAEALGRRPAAIESLHSQIEEIDAVSAVLRQRALELTQRLADEREFASDASHQLRTPLTALLIRIEEISMSDDPHEMRVEAASCIDQVERLTRVVDDLLRRSGTSAGPPTKTSLDSVLAALQKEWQPAFSRARRSIRMSGERDLRLMVRSDDLAQMLSTLLENALKHGSGRVQIEARRSGPSIVVEVSDEGAGIDASLAPHVFERRVTTGGTGLGLALARDLAQANGGRLELVTAQPARFALFLSADRGEAAQRVLG
ncbi:sensor histidine kinase [Dermacoccaceae bacterium W4C1]